MEHTGTSHNPKGQRGQWTSPLSYYRPGPRKGREDDGRPGSCDENDCELLFMVSGLTGGHLER